MTEQKKTQAPTQALAKRREEALTAELEAFKKESAGLVQVRSEILKVPRLYLVQKSSDIPESGLAKPGEFANKLLAKNYGSSIKIIPLMVSESASYMNKQTREITCSTDNLIQSKDGYACKECPHKEYWNDWGTKEAPKVPGCSTSFDLVFITPFEKVEDITPMIFSLRRTSAKAGKALINLMKYDSSGVPFGSVYTLKVQQASKDQHNFYIVNENIEKVSLEESKILEILPFAKKVLEYKMKGKIEQEDDSSTAY